MSGENTVPYVISEGLGHFTVTGDVIFLPTHGFLSTAAPGSSQIDTANKRYSMLGFCDSINASLPIPDGALDSGDRVHWLAIYRGAFEEAPAGGTNAGLLHHHLQMIGVH